MGLQDIKFNVHAHPTLSEVLDELFKAAHVETKAPGKVCSPFHICLTYTSCTVFTSAAAPPFRDQGPYRLAGGPESVHAAGGILRRQGEDASDCVAITEPSH